MDAREGIERLLFDYCDGIDTGNFAKTAALFGAAGLYGLVGSRSAASGADQVLATMQASIRTYDGVPRTRHVVTNAVIDIDDGAESGTARSYIQVLHAPPGGFITTVVAGSYHDRVHIVDGVWQFAERRMHIELTGDLTTHLQPGFL